MKYLPEMALWILIVIAIISTRGNASLLSQGLSLRPDLVLPPPIDTSDSKTCADSELAKGCKSWKQIGYCRQKNRFYEYMRVYCKKTCSLCDTQVACDDDPKYKWMCPTWKKGGSCTMKTGIFAAYIKQYCRKTCGFCKGGSEGNKTNEEKDQVNSPECGKGRGGINIQAGGGTAKKNSWPWQMSLNYYSRFFCGATLISKQWALTAAHCVATKADIPGEVTGKLGEHDRYIDEGREIEVKARKIIIHPDYSESPLKNDIALIKFKLPIKYNEYIKPACLPSVGERPSIGEYCFTTGWGRIRQKRGPAFRFLQEISIPVVKCNKCTKSNGFKIDENSLCAGFSPSEAVNGCTGDSGGPLNCEDADFNWKFQGILSWGNSQCPPGDQYKVFTRVESYRKWIDDQLAKN